MKFYLEQSNSLISKAFHVQECRACFTKHLCWNQWNLIWINLSSMYLSSLAIFFCWFMLNFQEISCYVSKQTLLQYHIYSHIVYYHHFFIYIFKFAWENRLVQFRQLLPVFGLEVQKKNTWFIQMTQLKRQVN